MLEDEERSDLQHLGPVPDRRVDPALLPSDVPQVVVRLEKSRVAIERLLVLPASINLQGKL